MCYDDARARVVMYGGMTIPYGSGAGLVGDTWEYDGNGWALAATFGPSPPTAPPRSTHLGLDLDRFELANGLRVVLVHDPTATEVEVTLTSLEFRLLTSLMSRVGRVQSREQLLEEVWGLSPETQTRTVDTHIKRLREKLGAARDLLETVRGAGYRLVDPAEK